MISAPMRSRLLRFVEPFDGPEGHRKLAGGVNRRTGNPNGARPGGGGGTLVFPAPLPGRIRVAVDSGGLRHRLISVRLPGGILGETVIRDSTVRRRFTGTDKWFFQTANEANPSDANDCRAGLIAPNFPMEEVDLVFLKKSREFLEQHVRKSPNKPFFLYHAAQAAHLPSFAAPQFKGATKAGPHGDFIHQLDWVVGELMATLEKLGVADNTLVIFTSDNGPETTSVIHMRADHDHDGARPWRGVKRDDWEGGHRVPFIVRWPGKTKAGATSTQLTSLTDVMATVAAITGTALPDNAAEDSFNMLPAFRSEDTAAIRPFLLQQAFGGARTLSIRRGPWKYLDHPGSGGNRYENNAEIKPFILPETAPDAPGQLYNLDTDPGETKNLFVERPEIVKELKALLDQSKSSGRSGLERATRNP